MDEGIDTRNGIKKPNQQFWMACPLSWMQICLLGSFCLKKNGPMLQPPQCDPTSKYQHHPKRGGCFPVRRSTAAVRQPASVVGSPQVKDSR